MRKKVVWQADAFEIVAEIGGETQRCPAAMVFDPHEPFILVSRAFPEGTDEASCLRVAVQEALFTYGVMPDALQVLWRKHRAIKDVASRCGFTLTLCEELPELAEVKADFGRYARRALAVLGQQAR